jgi:hypothetical protein
MAFFSGEEPVMKRTMLLVSTIVTALFMHLNTAAAAPAGMPVANKRLGPVLKMILEETYYGYETPGGIMVSVGGVYDKIYERKLDVFDDDAELESGYGSLTITLGNVIDFYGLIGGVADGGINGIGMEDVDVRFSGGDLLWGGGVNTVLLRSVNGKYTLFAGGIYRTVSDLEYDRANINGTRYEPTAFEASEKAEWKEWQGSLGVSAEISGYYEPGGYNIYFVPYAGAKYSDVEMFSSVTINSTQYRVEDAGSDENIGMFVGALLNFGAVMSFEVEGRFIDETALTAQAYFRF